MDDNKVTAKARAEDIIRLLDHRAVALTRGQIAAIRACTDLEVLDRWFDAAVDARTADDLFED